METIEAAAGFVEDFFDFPPEIVEQNPQKPEDQEHEHEQNHKENPKKHGSQAVIDDEEEELEWLSNEDAFPSLETFQVPLQKPLHGPKRHSPVSVLESSVGSVGFGVPVRPRSKRKRRRIVTGFSVAESVGRRKCEHCLSETTPQWRAGPLGPKTLCNACGVRYKSGRLVPEYRPARSPTFSSDLHSNSHRKIMEMRKKKHRGFLKDYGS